MLSSSTTSRLSHSRPLGGLVVQCRRRPLTMFTLPTLIKFDIFEGCTVPHLTMSMTRLPCLGLNSQSPQYPMQYLHMPQPTPTCTFASSTGFPLLDTKTRTKMEGRYLDDVKCYAPRLSSRTRSKSFYPASLAFQWRYMLKLC